MKILVADDHAIVRKGLVQLLLEQYPQAEVCEATNSNEVLEQVSRETWDAILLDISMRGRDGIDTLKQMRSDGVTAPILMLSAQSEDQYALRVLKAGASGFLSKESAPDELLVALKKILAGKKYVSSKFAERLLEMPGSLETHQSHAQLSDREMQVLKLMAAGRTVSQVAEEISLSINTISTYRARILEKLRLQNNSELTRYALDNGLV
ncbi:MAG: response regulator transcription factor [Chryseolinea sp.]